MKGRHQQINNNTLSLMNSLNGIYLDAKVGGREGGMTKEETVEQVRWEEGKGRASERDGKKCTGSKGGVCYWKA